MCNIHHVDCTGSDLQQSIGMRTLPVLVECTGQCTDSLRIRTAGQSAAITSYEHSCLQLQRRIASGALHPGADKGSRLRAWWLCQHHMCHHPWAHFAAASCNIDYNMHLIYCTFLPKVRMCRFANKHIYILKAIKQFLRNRVKRIC